MNDIVPSLNSKVRLKEIELLDDIEKLFRLTESNLRKNISETKLIQTITAQFRSIGKKINFFDQFNDAVMKAFIAPILIYYRFGKQDLNLLLEFEDAVLSQVIPNPAFPLECIFLLKRSKEKNTELLTWDFLNFLAYINADNYSTDDDLSISHINRVNEFIKYTRTNEHPETKLYQNLRKAFSNEKCDRSLIKKVVNDFFPESEDPELFNILYLNILEYWDMDRNFDTEYMVQKRVTLLTSMMMTLYSNKLASNRDDYFLKYISFENLRTIYSELIYIEETYGQSVDARDRVLFLRAMVEREMKKSEAGSVLSDERIEALAHDFIVICYADYRKVYKLMNQFISEESIELLLENETVEEKLRFRALANQIPETYSLDDFFIEKYFIENSDKNTAIESMDGIIEATNKYQRQGADIRNMDVKQAFKMSVDGAKKINSQLRKVGKALKDFAFDTKDMDRVVIEGKQFTFIGLVKKVIRGVALFNWSWIGAIMFYIVKWSTRKKVTAASKRKMVMMLETELELVKEKVEDARADGDRKAKYSLMRSQKEIENAIKRVRYNMGAEVSSPTIQRLLDGQKDTDTGRGKSNRL